MIGRVVSAKMSETATVLIERIAVHPLYKKTFIRSKKYLVDDPFGAKEGDMVEIVKVRPISKNKHWKVVKIVGKNLAEVVEKQQKEVAEKLVAEIMPEEKEEPKENQDDKQGNAETQKRRKRGSTQNKTDSSR